MPRPAAARAAAPAAAAPPAGPAGGRVRFRDSRSPRLGRPAGIFPAMASRMLSAFVAAALVAAVVPAQIAKGSPAPAIPFVKTWNDAPASWDELAGKVVILKFSETW
jgi:hypothetical protein